MAEGKDLYDLFRENAGKISENPSPQAWRRLERRLESKKKKRGPVYLKSSLAIAATILVLIVVAGLITVMVTRNHQAQLALAEQKNTPPASASSAPDTFSSTRSNAPLQPGESPKIAETQRSPKMEHPPKMASAKPLSRKDDIVDARVPSTENDINISGSPSQTDKDHQKKLDVSGIPVEVVAADSQSYPAGSGDVYSSKAMAKTSIPAQKEMSNATDDIASPVLNAFKWMKGQWKSVSDASIQENWIVTGRQTLQGIRIQRNKDGNNTPLASFDLYYSGMALFFTQTDQNLPAKTFRHTNTRDNLYEFTQEGAPKPDTLLLQLQGYGVMVRTLKSAEGASKNEVFKKLQ